MSGTNAAQVFRLFQFQGPGKRLWLRSEGGNRIHHLGLSGFRGPAFPAMITNLSLERRGEADGRSWQLTCDQGRFDFEAQAVESIETRPALYSTLHRPFALSTIDRMAVRVLLALLRLPGGAKLLRLWHARRSA